LRVCADAPVLSPQPNRVHTTTLAAGVMRRRRALERRFSVLWPLSVCGRSLVDSII
jgi:hypothetical protein